MKYLMVVLALVMCVGLVGCLTGPQQKEVDRVTIKLADSVKRIAELEGQIVDILAKAEAGIIPAAEAKKLYDDIKVNIKETRAAADDYQTTIDNIRGDGASKLDIVTGTILSIISIAGSLLGVRVWRGGTANRYGDIGVVK